MNQTQTQSLLIVTAFAPETDAVLDILTVEQGGWRSESLKGFPFGQGIVNGHDVILLETGLSLVNAAMSLQFAIDHFAASCVFSAGISGGVDPNLKVGDVVIPERWAYHSESVYLNKNEDDDGYVRPSALQTFNPKRANFGMIFPFHVLARQRNESDYRVKEFFDVDASLFNAAQTTVRTAFGDDATNNSFSVHIGGCGTSGTVFVDNREYREWVYKVWQARCLDKETTAYAQVCYANQIPFLAVPGLSDLAGGQQGQNELGQNRGSSSRNAATVLAAVIEESVKRNRSRRGP